LVQAKATADAALAAITALAKPNNADTLNGAVTTAATALAQPQADLDAATAAAASAADDAAAAATTTATAQ